MDFAAFFRNERAYRERLFCLRLHYLSHLHQSLRDDSLRIALVCAVDSLLTIADSFLLDAEASGPREVGGRDGAAHLAPLLASFAAKSQVQIAITHFTTRTCS